MKILPLQPAQHELIYEMHFKPLEYTSRIIELAIALHMYADFEMIGVNRHEGEIKQVYAYDVARRIYSFKGPGKLTSDVDFEHMRRIDEDTVRRLYQVDNELVQRIANVAQVLWSTISWNERSTLKKTAKFAQELENLCGKYNISLQTTDPNGIIMRPYFEEGSSALTPGSFPGEYRIIRNE